jgi:hypothetical protein
VSVHKLAEYKRNNFHLGNPYRKAVISESV